MEDFVVDEVSMEEDIIGNQVLGIVARPSKVYDDVAFGQNEQDSYPIVNKAAATKSRLLPDEDLSLSQEEVHGHHYDEGPNFKYKTANVPPTNKKRIYESINPDGDVELHDTAIEHKVVEIAVLHNINVQKNTKQEKAEPDHSIQGIILDESFMSRFDLKWKHKKAEQSGTFGSVITEIDPVTKQSLAIKRSNKKVMCNELTMTLKLRKAPNIQRLAGVFCDDVFCYTVMQDAGINLKRFGSLPDYQASLHTKPQLRGLLHDLLSAFCRLHEIGVHCDVKPENICVTWCQKLDRFIATVIDFGSSMFHSDEIPENHGITFEYLPPDYIGLCMNNKGRRITASDDVYAVALVMLFLREGNHATIKYILNRCDPPMEYYPQGNHMKGLRHSVITEIGKFQGEQLPSWFLNYPHCTELEPLLQRMLWLKEDGRCDAQQALTHLNMIMGCNPPQNKKKKVMYRSPSTFDDSYGPPSPGLSLTKGMSQLKMRDGSCKQTQSNNLRESMSMNQMDYQDMDVRRKNETVVSKSISNQKTVFTAARASKVLPPEDEDYKGQVMNDDDKAMLQDLFNVNDTPKIAVIQKESPKPSHTTTRPTKSPDQGSVTYMVKPRQVPPQGHVINHQGLMINQQGHMINHQGHAINHHSHVINPAHQVTSMTYRGGRVVKVQGARPYMPGVLHCQGEAGQSLLERPVVSGLFAGRPKLTGKRMSSKRMEAPSRGIQTQPHAMHNPGGMNPDETAQQDIPAGNVPNFDAMFE